MNDGEGYYNLLDLNSFFALGIAEFKNSSLC